MARKFFQSARSYRISKPPEMKNGTLASPADPSNGLLEQF
jgi:hypothetical protein